ncbi:MAG TPA: hypothetical protein PK908_01680 [Bacteroidales bacterium]|nr:hypothetical protein [Bacteroidales bacterium]
MDQTLKSPVRITESPRDAMQGLKHFIPTDNKIRYINALLKVGFDIIDFFSFVSPKAIPQFSDVNKAMSMLDLSDTDTELLTIIGNTKWGEEAAKWEIIDWFGFPFSISETFQKMNLNSSHEHSLETVKRLLEITDKNNKDLRCYLSMAFGNPYGEKWDIDIVTEWIYKLNKEGVRHIAISDTIGVSKPKDIHEIFTLIFKEFPETDFGFHLHTSKKGLFEKIEAAWEAGCRNFDSVLTGIGGCPLSGYELVGNLDTLDLISFINEKNIPHRIDNDMLSDAVRIAGEIFSPLPTSFSPVSLDL